MELRPDREAKAWLRSRTLGAPLACTRVQGGETSGGARKWLLCPHLLRQLAGGQQDQRQRAVGPGVGTVPLAGQQLQDGAGGGGHWLNVGCEPLCGLRTSTCNLRLSRERPKTLA